VTRTPRRRLRRSATLLLVPLLGLLPAGLLPAPPAAAEAAGELVSGTVVQVATETGAAHDGLDTFLDTGRGGLKPVTDAVGAGRAAAAPDGARVADLDPGAGVTLRVRDADAAELQVVAVHSARPADAVADPAATAPAPAPGPAAGEPASTPAPVPQTVRIAMVRPAGVAADASPATPAQAEAALAAASAYWGGQTDGALTFGLSAPVVDWYASTATCAAYNALWSEAATRTGFTHAPGDHLVLLLPRQASLTGGCSYGLGTIGASATAGGMLYVTDVEPSLWAHELGHNVGLGHANALRHPTLQDVAHTAAGYPGATLLGYGDLFDVMSFSGATIGHGNLGAAGQAQLGLELAGLRTVTTSGTYALRALPVTGDGQVHGLRVVDGGVPYFVELRGSSPGDDLVASDARRPAKGVRVTKRDDGEAHATVVLDATPTSASTDCDWSLPVGATLDSAAGTLHVTTLAADATSATVRIELGAAATAPAAPTGVTAVLDGGGPAAAPTATVRWSAGADGGSPVTGWVLTPVRDGRAGTPVALPATSATGPSATVPVQPGSRYAFSVAAVNARGTSPAAVSAALDVPAPTPLVVVPPPVVPVAPPVVPVAPPVPAPTATPTPAPPAPTPTPEVVARPDGSLAYTHDGRTHAVGGPVLDRYRQAGGPTGALGWPTSDAVALPGGAVTSFEHGAIYTTPADGAHVVAGAVQRAWAAQGWERSPLGFPVGDAFAVRNGGTVQRFQGGLFYDSPATGTHEVRGAILDRYAATGWEDGGLGFPVTGEVALPGGAFTAFQGGAVYWTPAAGAHVVAGAVQRAWATQGWEHSPLGFPVGDAFGVKDGGLVQRFQGGLFYDSPATGPHEVRGAILDRYAAGGWENGGLGFPVTGEVALRGGAFTAFQGGAVYWSPATGAHAVAGPLRDAWARQGWEDGRLGYPVGEPRRVAGGTRQDFQHGALVLSAATGRVAVRTR